MATTMTEKRNITKEDIFLEARLRAEGARIEVKNGWERFNIYQAVILDGSEIVMGVWRNPTSHLEVVFDGDKAAVLDGSEVLGTGTTELRPPWRDELLSDGTPVQSAPVPWNADILSIILTQNCFYHDVGKTCKYCACNLAPTGPRAESSVLEASKARQVEAIALAIQHGWRGTINFSGGTPHPPERGKTIDEIERIMTQLRDAVGDDALSENHISMALLPPPNDLKDLHRWKEIGLNSVEFDIQIVAPEYFEAICPGRGAKAMWNEGQAAAAEVFGRGRGCTAGIVMGLEPMNGLLEGIEERVQDGVFTQLFNFIPIPGTPYGGMMPPSAPWFVEAAEKIADIYLKHADTFEVDLTEDDRFGYTRRGRSFYLSIVDDEMARRLQEMGKMGPGLPKQDG